MISFVLSLLALLAGYLFYGKFIEKIFGPDPKRLTPAIAKSDGVDYIAMPGWKVFLIQFLNIAGTGPIFGAIMGAKFGPAAYLWIVLGCIFAGGVHDYLCGMLSLRHAGAGVPEIVGRYLGRKARGGMLVFSVFLLLMVGVVFVFSPALILGQMCGTQPAVWVFAIFAYYILATMLPIDKVIGRIYPLFAFSLIFMAVALMAVLYIKMPQLPELWNGLHNMGTATDPGFTEQIFPCLFITIACGALSGFHATQSPLMARCIDSERHGRAVFYGAMITEGLVALVWATVAMYFFYNAPESGYALIDGPGNQGFHTAAPAVVTLVCQDWLGIAGGILAVLGVVAAPITSGDTAFRSARLIIADFLHLPQKPIRNRLIISIPLFILASFLLWYNIADEDGFNVIWRYFGWANQTLAVFMLWTATAYLVKYRGGMSFMLTLLPAAFMTAVCVTYLCVAKIGLNLPVTWNWYIGISTFVLSLAVFSILYMRRKQNSIN